jgi:hypothetical protein
MTFIFVAFGFFALIVVGMIVAFNVWIKRDATRRSLEMAHPDQVLDRRGRRVR